MICDAILNDWHAIASCRELQQNKLLGRELLGERIVLWSDGSEIHAMADRCPHRGTRLSLGHVNKGLLVCPYHGWQFDHAGGCAFQPAQPAIRPSAGTAIIKYPLVERYGLIWVCLGKAPESPPQFKGLDDDYHLVITGPYDVATSAPRVVENFLDVAHLPFVHAGMLGDEAHAEIKDYEVNSSSEGVEVRNFRIWQPNASSVHTEGQEITYSYDILRPYSIMLSKSPATVEEKPTDMIFLTVAPIQELNVRAWIIMATTYGSKETEQAVHDFQDKIFMQDKDILESQIPQRLPLQTNAEKHQRADKASLEYRRWLEQLGVNYGTM